MVSVREARVEDDFRIGELLVEAFVGQYAKKMPHVVVNEPRKSELRDVAAKRKLALVLVAEHAQKIVGTVALFKPGAATSEAWISNHADLRHLAVDPKMLGHGISKLLLERAEEVARDEWRCDGICLHVRQGAHGVARLYESRNYLRRPDGDFEKPGVFLEGRVLTF